MAQHFTASLGNLRNALSSADLAPGLQVGVVNERLLSIGSPEAPRLYLYDLAQERLIKSASTASVAQSSGNRAFDLPPGKAQRSRSSYTFAHGETEFARASLADLLEAVLLYLEMVRPGTLSKLSQEKTRTRRILSKDRNDLFDKKHLSRKYARAIAGGWWMGTNNSADQTKAWIRRACRIAGVEPTIGI
jgi:hypothetical protein